MQQRGSITALVSCQQECHQIQACHLEGQQAVRSSVDGAMRVLCAWQGNERWQILLSAGQKETVMCGTDAVG